MAGAMLLSHIGETAAAERVVKAVEQVIAQGEFVTPDINPASTAGTTGMGDAIVAALKAQ
jgi:isocitrate dehydrogenase (NAD+)